MLYTAGHWLELNNDSMNDARWLSTKVRTATRCSPNALVARQVGNELLSHLH